VCCSLRADLYSSVVESIHRGLLTLNALFAYASFPQNTEIQEMLHHIVFITPIKCSAPHPRTAQMPDIKLPQSPRAGSSRAAITPSNACLRPLRHLTRSLVKVLYLSQREPRYVKVLGLVIFSVVSSNSYNSTLHPASKTFPQV